MRNQILGNRYRIIDRIGEGGMAYVYVALDEKLRRKVAIKVLHEHMEKNPDIRKRFQLEAQAVSALEHPNIVKIYDFSGEYSERLWIVTEVIRGKNLAQYAQSIGPGWVNPVLSACIVREICKALDKAHEEGIIHRDIKPENIMLTSEGRVKLMDFGIAKDLGKAGMTIEGTFMGSPSYMSPEQIRGRNVDLRSDLYSLSVLFYEIATGRLPFIGTTTHDVVLRIIEGEYTHPRYLMPTIPISINEMIVKGMSKSPEARFQTAREFGRELDLFLSGLNFDESHIELERYFKDPQAYGSRLEKSGIATQTARLTRNPQLAIPHPSRLGGRTNGPKTTVKLDPRRTLSNSTQLQRKSSDSLHTPQIPTLRLQVPPTRPTTNNHLAGGKGESYVLLPPTLPPPPRASPKPSPAALEQGINRNVTSIEPSKAVYGIAQAPQRRVPMRHLRRDAGHVARRNNRQLQAPQSWALMMLGALLVGLVIMITSWGFWQLERRLTSMRKHQQVQTSPALQSANAPSKPRKAPKRREGTPVVIRKLTKHNSRAQELTTPSKPLPVRTGRKKPKKIITRKKITIKDNPMIVEVTDMAKAKRKKKPTQSSLMPVALQSSVTTEADIATPELTPPVLPQPTPKLPGEKSPQLIPTKKSDQETDKKNDKSKDDRTNHDELPSDLSVASKGDPKPAGKAKFAVSSQPAAEWYLDGKRIGTTIDATAHSGFHTVDPGKHNLELKRQGYRNYKTQFELAPGEQKILPQIDLEPDGDAATPKTTTLTQRIERTPTSVVIRNMDQDTTQAFVMQNNTRTLQLENGRYHITIEYEGETKIRDLVLSGKQVTFSANFKGKTNITPMSEEPKDNE